MGSHRAFPLCVFACDLASVLSSAIEHPIQACSIANLSDIPRFLNFRLQALQVKGLGILEPSLSSPSEAELMLSSSLTSSALGVSAGVDGVVAAFLGRFSGFLVFSFSSAGETKGGTLEGSCWSRARSFEGVSAPSCWPSEPPIFNISSAAFSIRWRLDVPVPATVGAASSKSRLYCSDTKQTRENSQANRMAATTYPHIL